VLQNWARENGVNLEARKHLIVDAGMLVPGFSKDGPEHAEFFVHCPFAWRTNENELVERNQDSIVFQITFKEDRVESYALFASDVDHETLSLIAQISKAHGNEHRLLWDFMKLPHHCSYTALGPDRGTDETEAVPDVKWLFETQGNRGAYIVSTSKPIPVKGSTDDENVQPPHRQAANHHKRVVRENDGTFVVTMEHPKLSDPKTLRFEVTRFKVALILSAPTIIGSATSTAARAG
jgi:hypothetical protein